MASEFIRKGSPSLDKLVLDATTQDTNIGDAYERLKAELHSSLGMIVPEPSQNEVLYGRAALPAPAPMPPASYVGQHQYEQVIYPHGNDRYVVTANSEEELAQKIARIQALYE